MSDYVISELMEWSDNTRRLYSIIVSNFHIMPFYLSRDALLLTSELLVAEGHSDVVNAASSDTITGRIYMGRDMHITSLIFDTGDQAKMVTSLYASTSPHSIRVNLVSAIRIQQIYNMIKPKL